MLDGSGLGMEAGLGEYDCSPRSGPSPHPISRGWHSRVCAMELAMHGWSAGGSVWQRSRS